MTVLEIVRSKLNNNEIADFDIIIAIEEVAEVIKNYCNITDIPEGLKYTWANMATDLVRYQNALDNAGHSPQFNTDDVSTLKIGDTQIGLGGNESANSKLLAGHKINLDDIILNYKAQLQRYRRMVW